MSKKKSNFTKEGLTTSKKVLWLSWIVLIVLIILTAIGIETGIYAEIVGGIITVVVTSLYTWKARTENKIKITIGMLDQLEHRENLEAIADILTVIFNDN